MKRACFFLILFFFGCIRTPFKVRESQEVQTLFLSLTSEQKKQGVDDKLLSFVESNLKKVLSVHKYQMIDDKKVACYQLLLDFTQHDHKNPFLNKDGLSMGKPFSYEIMVTLFKNNKILLNQSPLVFFDFFIYPIDVHFRDWYSEVNIEERGQSAVERIMLLFEAWVKNG